MTGFDCADCRIDTNAINEYYMVTEEIWESHGVGEAMLCVGCLERRIDRRLSKADFMDCLLNELDMGWKKSERLIERLTE